jgi:hypothetical protein
MNVYHFAKANEKGQPVLRKGGIVLTPGLELRMRGPIIPCKRGYHGSARALDALKYAQGAWLNVRDLGDNAIAHDGDKHVSGYVRVLAVLDTTTVLHEFACDEAERALRLASVTDERSWQAIAMKRAWLRGEAADEELAAAWAAARAAAWDVAWDAAWDVVWDVAWDAARDAAWAVARDAAWAAAWAAARDVAWDVAWDAARDAAWAAAWAAARDAARDAANARLEAMLRQAMEAA